MHRLPRRLNGDSQRDRLLQTRNELNEAMSLRDSRDDAEAERRLRAMDSADDDPPQKGAALSQEPPVDLRQRLDNKRAEATRGSTEASPQCHPGWPDYLGVNTKPTFQFGFEVG